MIQWYHKLYMDDKISTDMEYYKCIVENDKIHIPQVYCIMMPSNPDNLLDIVSCNEILFKHYKRNDLKIIGLASSKKSAFNVVEAIVLEMYNATGEFNIEDYLGCDK